MAPEVSFNHFPSAQRMLLTLWSLALALAGAVLAIPDAAQKAPYGYATLNGGQKHLKL